MKASVIVPVYNSYVYLQKCIDSIMKQTEKDFELILINDCSPDNSQEIIDKYVNNYPDKIKCIINEKNIGQGCSRVKALDIASGEYIFFVDSDDYISEDYLDRFLSEVKKKKYDVVVAGYTKVIGDKLVKHDIVKNMWTLVCYPVACCKMYRKDFIIENDIDFSDVRIGEDIYFTLDYFASGPSAKFIDYYGYYYRFNPTSTTNTIDFSSKHEEAVSAMFAKLLNKYDISKLSQKKQYMIEYSYVANMVNALITYASGCKPRKMRAKYKLFVDDLNEKFPNWRNNPYYRITRLKGPNNKIKFGNAFTINAIKMKLGWPMYWVISLIKL